YDFLVLHYKDTDKAGEDGDFGAKVAALERLDASVPDIRALKPDVLVVTGDHATPSVLAAHGWQPVPVLLWSRYCGADPVTAFTERACAAGSLGVLPSHHLMPLVMAHARRHTHPHERERGHREPGQRAARRPAWTLGTDPPQHPREPRPVVERRDAHRHPPDGARAAPGTPRRARRPRAGTRPARPPRAGG